MALSSEVLKKASILEKVLYHCGKDKRISEALKEKYAKKQIEQQENKINDTEIDSYIEYIKENNIIICKLKMLCCLTVMDKSNFDNKLPPQRAIPEHINYRISKTTIQYYFKILKSQGWINKIDNVCPKKRGFKVLISRGKAVGLFNFICSYEHLKQQQDKSTNYKLKQLKRMIEKYSNYDYQIEKEMIKDIERNNKVSSTQF